MTIAQVIAEGRLIRRQWSREEHGRQLLCLYTAMVGDPAARPESCPADVCPAWLAHLLPWIDDYGSEKHWHGVVARVARLAPRFGTLPLESEWRVRAICVREAMRHTDDNDALAVCERVATLCETGKPAPKELAEAEKAAWAVAADVAAAEAAWGAARTAAAEAAEAAWAAAWAAEEEGTAAEEAADRIIDAILDEIERTLEAS